MVHHVHHYFAQIHAGGLSAYVIGFILIVFVSYVPVLPIPLIAAALGASTPIVPAILVTWVAASFGALSKFFLERWFFRKPANRLLSRYRNWRRIVSFVENHGFYAVFLTRLIPVFPSSIVNTAGAVTGVSIAAFVYGTLLGKLPTMAVFTFAGKSVLHHFWTAMGWLSVYGLLLGLLTWWFRRFIKKSEEETENQDSDADESNL